MAATAKDSFLLSSIWEAEDGAAYLSLRARECKCRDLGCVEVEAASERTLKGWASVRGRGRGGMVVVRFS